MVRAVTVFPHEKHFIFGQLRCAGRNRDCCRDDCCSAKYVRSIVSNPAGSAGTGGTGLRCAVSDNKSWTNLSIGDVSGVFAGVGTAGVSIVSNLFSNSSIWLTELFGLFTVTTRTGSVSYSDSWTT